RSKRGVHVGSGRGQVAACHEVGGPVAVEDGEQAGIVDLPRRLARHDAVAGDIDRVAVAADAHAGVDVIAEVDRVAFAVPGQGAADLLSVGIDARAARQGDGEQGEAQAVRTAGSPRLVDGVVGIVLV